MCKGLEDHRHGKSAIAVGRDNISLNAYFRLSLLQSYVCGTLFSYCNSHFKKCSVISIVNKSVAFKKGNKAGGRCSWSEGNWICCSFLSYTWIAQGKIAPNGAWPEQQSIWPSVAPVTSALKMQVKRIALSYAVSALNPTMACVFTAIQPLRMTEINLLMD